MRRAIVLCLLVLGCTSVARATVLHVYEQVVWNHPVAPQDPNSLPSNPADVAMDRYVVSTSQFNSAFASRETGTGNVPASGNNGYDFRASADSDYTHLRASLSATFDEFPAYSHFPGFYQDADGNPTALDALDQTLLGRMETLVAETIEVTGVAGTVQLSLQFDLRGSQRNDWLGGETPGFASRNMLDLQAAQNQGFPADADGFLFPAHNGTVDETVLLTIDIPAGTEATYVYSMLLWQFLDPWYTRIDEAERALATLLTGTIGSDFSSTAVLEKIILTVPEGTDLSGVGYRFASGTNYNVEVRAGSTAVPEPGAFALLALGALCMAAMRFRRDHVRSGIASAPRTSSAHSR